MTPDEKGEYDAPLYGEVDRDGFAMIVIGIVAAVGFILGVISQEVKYEDGRDYPKAVCALSENGPYCISIRMRKRRVRAFLRL